MTVDEIELKTANNEMNPAQVFTQMMQHINALEKQSKVMRDALEFYANEDNYEYDDGGNAILAVTTDGVDSLGRAEKALESLKD